MKQTVEFDKLIILSGVSGAGKTRFINSLLSSGVKRDAIINVKKIKKNLLGDFKTLDRFGVNVALYGEEVKRGFVLNIIKDMVSLRLEQKLPTIIEDKNLSDEARKEYVDLAKHYGMDYEIFICDESLDKVIEKNKKKKRRVEEENIVQQFNKFKKDSRFNYSVVDSSKKYTIIPKLLESKNIDVIGDVHGLLDDLVALLQKAGWEFSKEVGFFNGNTEKKLLFLGDLIDRGDKSIDVLRAVKKTVDNGFAIMLLGNHEEKLLDSYFHFKSNGSLLHKSVAASITLYDFLRLDYHEQTELITFLRQCPIRASLWIDKKTGNLTKEAGDNFKLGFCHANLPIFDEIYLPKSFAIYGNRTYNKRTDNLYQKNYDSGVNSHVLFHGHIPNTSNEGAVFSLEDGQAFCGNIVLLNLDRYVDLVRKNNWSLNHDFFEKSTIKHKTKFNFNEFLEKKMELLKEMNSLVMEGLATDGWRKNEKGNKVPHEDGFKIFKYGKKVHFKKLWKTNPWLEKARGLVLDSMGNVVVHPFDKTYNFGEYDTGKNVPLEQKVISVEKMNGFLGCISKHPFKNELLLTTTGSIADDAPFVKKIDDFVTSEVKGRLLAFFAKNDVTLMFEVIHPEDPHIIQYGEKDFGLWLIGMRGKKLEDLPVSESVLDGVASSIGFKRPKWEEVVFSDLLKSLEVSEEEGRMVRDLDGNFLMKIKTNYYLVTKFVGRMGDKMVEMMYERPEQFKKDKVDEEFYPLVDKIINTVSKDEFSSMVQEDRVVFVRDLVNQLRKEYLSSTKKTKKP